MTTAPPFATVLKRAEKRKGGRAPLEALLPAPPATPAKLKRLTDAQALSALVKNVFRAGFNWSVVDQKWPEIEELMFGFDPKRVATLTPRKIAALMEDKRMIRNRMRLDAAIDNARWFLDIRAEYGGFGPYLAQWPSSDIVGLWLEMKQFGARAGGSTGQYFLRELGKDCFMTTPSVLAALVLDGVIDRPTTSKGNLLRAQAAFNAWHADTGRPYDQLSRIVACSADPKS